AHCIRKIRRRDDGAVRALDAPVPQAGLGDQLDHRRRREGGGEHKVRLATSVLSTAAFRACLFAAAAAAAAEAADRRADVRALSDLAARNGGNVPAQP